MRKTITGLSPGITYAIQVRSRSGSEVSEWSRTFIIDGLYVDVEPAQPQNFAGQVKGDSFVFTWDAVTKNADDTPIYDLSHYEVMIKNNATDVTVAIPTTDTTLDFSFNRNLAAFGDPAASITAYVEAVDREDNRSLPSNSVTLTNPPPGPVQNLNVTGILAGIDVTWEPPLNLEDDFKEYRVHVGDNNGFVLENANLVWRGQGTAYTYQTLTDADHYFKVVAVDKFNSSSTTVTAGPARPILPTGVDSDAPATPTSLAGTISGTTMTVTWVAPPNPDNDLAGYTIRYRPTGTTVWSTAQATHEQTSTTVQVEEYKDYDLQIQAWDFSTNRSDWSSIVTATGATNVAPAVPDGVTVIGGMQTAMVKWDAVADADLKEYEVQFSDVSPSSDSTPTPVKVSGTITSFTNLDANKTYYARVRAVDTGGLKSAWSSIVSDNVGIVITSPTDGNPPPSSPAPTATSGIGTIFLSWNPVLNPDPVTYEIHMGTTTGFTPGPGTKVGETASTFTNISKGPGGSALAYGTNYYFKIIAKDDDGPAAASAASGAAQNLKVGLSDTQNVKTDGNPPASSPTPTVTGSIKSLFVKWNAVANNDPVVYEVHVGTTNNFTAGAGTKVGETSSTFTTITKLPDGNDLDYETTYYVRLIAKDADGAAAVSAASSGATAVYVPTQSDLSTLDGRIDNAIKSSVIEYAVNSSESTPPAGGWSSATPTRTPGQFIWFRTVITYGDDTTSTSSPALLTGNAGPAGTPAKYITLAATTQVLSSPPGGGATTPATAVITGTATNTTITTWEYKVDGGSFVTTAPTGVSRTGNEVTITGSTFAGKTITVRMTDGATASDEITVAKVSDGAPGAAGGAGQDAITVILTNESHTFPGDVNNALAGSTTTEIRAFKGSTAQNITVGTITGAVTGLSASLTSGQGTTSPLITFTATTALTATSGKFTIPLTIDGKAFNKEFSWSVARKGATGAAGVGVASTEIRYQVHTNGTTAPTGTWLSSVPATSPGQFLWTRTVTNYTDSTSSTSYSVAAHGATGAAGTGITGTVVNYAKSSDGVNAPASGWGTSIPSTSPGEFLWTRTVTSYSSGSPTTAYSVAAHGQTGPPGADAKTISVTATSQVMTHAAATPTTTSPATVTVTATPVNTTVTTWQYAVDGGSFTGTKPAYISTPSGNQVTVTGSTMTNKTVSIRAADASGNADSITIAKVSDGATGSAGGQGPAGADAYTVLLGNEAHTFPGSTTAAIAGNTVVPVIAYKGSTQVAATIGTITGQVTGLTTSIQNNGTTTAQFTVTVTTSLTAQAGVLTVPITVDGNTFTKRFSWSVSRTGATGNTGSPGVSVTAVTPFFRTVTAGAAAPAQPTGTANPSGWSTTEPAWTANTDLYRTERISYSNSTATWTPVTKVSTYEAAAIAITADKRVQSAERAPNKTTDIVNVPVGAFFYEYGAATSPGTGTVLKQTYIWDGSDWQPRGIDRTFLPAVDIGTGTFGDLNGNRLVANSVTANKINTDDLAANTAFIDTLTGTQAFIDSVTVKAANITGVLTIGKLPAEVATDDDVAGVENRTLSRSTDMVTNGTGSLQTNYNFSWADLDMVDAPTGAIGAFKNKTTAAGAKLIDEYLPFDPSKKYRFSFKARQTVPGATNRMYAMLAPYDAQGRSIQPNHYMFVPNTTTTLAQPLNNGDTVVHLTSAANWYGSAAKPAGTNSHYRSIIIWNWTDENGKTWPPHTYSRNVSGSNRWNDGSVNTTNNTITLNTPWAWGNYPAGTVLSNGSSGGSYMYMTGVANVVVPEEWTDYGNVFSAGIMADATASSGRSNATWQTGVPPGTAQIKIGWLLNYAPSPANPIVGRHSIASVSFSDASAAATVAGEVKGLTDSWVSPGTTTINGGMITTNTIGADKIKTAELYADSTFTTNLIANAATIGALTFDKIDGGTGIINNVDIKSTLTIRPSGKIVVADTGTIESSNFGANAGYRLTNNSLEINEGVIKAAALETQVGQNLVPGPYAGFEMAAPYYDSMQKNECTGTIMTTGGKFGKQFLRMQSTTNGASSIYLGAGATDYNISVEPGQSYIMSAYFRGTGAGVSTNAYIYARGDNGTNIALANRMVEIDDDWERVSAVVTIPANVTSVILFIYTPTPSTSASVDVDGVQFELKTSNSNEPSAWMPGSNMTHIDGNIIRTGEIRSNIDGPISGQPAWSINMAGGAQFGDAAIRGTLVVGTTGGEAASFVQSANYVAGGTGWKIDGAGVGEFNTLKLGNTIIQKNWIETGGFKADYITAGSINATLTITSGIIRTAASGARTEMTSTGLKIYNGSNQVILDATGGSVSAVGTLAAKSSPTTNEGIIIGPSSLSGYLIGRIEFSPPSAVHDINPFISHGTEGGAGMVEMNGGRNTSSQDSPYIRVVGGHFNNNDRGIIRVHAGQVYIGNNSTDTIIIGDSSGDYLTSIQSRTIFLGSSSTSTTRSVNLGNANLRWLGSTGTPIASISRNASNHLTIAADNNLYLTSGMFSAIYMEGYSVTGSWQPYTPSWLGTTTNPSTSGHTRTGWYMRIGRTVHLDITITVGTSGKGSGLYMFTLPFDATPDRDQILQAYVLVSGSGEMSGVAKIETTALDRVNRVYLVNQTRANNYYSALGSSYPSSLPSGSVIKITGVYECM